MVVGLVVIVGLGIYAARKHQKKKRAERAQKEGVDQKGEIKLSGQRQRKTRRRWLSGRHRARGRTATSTGSGTNEEVHEVTLPESYYPHDAPPPYYKSPSKESLDVGLVKGQLLPNDVQA